MIKDQVQLEGDKWAGSKISVWIYYTYLLPCMHARETCTGDLHGRLTRAQGCMILYVINRTNPTLTTYPLNHNYI